MSHQDSHPSDPNLENFPEWYDASMSWDARLRREIPILTDVFGPPGDGGLLDAGCGTGHHSIALARLGYRAVGADVRPGMLEIARRHAHEKGADVSFVLSPYATLLEKTGGGFDGVFCLADSLTSAGTADEVAEALQQFARCLRPGGRFCIEVLNFTPMLPHWKDSDDAASMQDAGDNGSAESAGPDDAGAHVAHAEPDGFLLDPSVAKVVKINIGDEQQRQPSPETRRYRLYPVSLTEFRTWCQDAGLHIDEQWGSVARDPYDVNKSVEMISIGTRR